MNRFRIAFVSALTSAFALQACNEEPQSAEPSAAQPVAPSIAQSESPEAPVAREPRLVIQSIQRLDGLGEEGGAQGNRDGETPLIEVKLHKPLPSDEIENADVTEDAAHAKVMLANPAVNGKNQYLPFDIDCKPGSAGKTYRITFTVEDSFGGSGEHGVDAGVLTVECQGCTDHTSCGANTPFCRADVNSNPETKSCTACADNPECHSVTANSSCLDTGACGSCDNNCKDEYSHCVSGDCVCNTGYYQPSSGACSECDGIDHCASGQLTCTKITSGKTDSKCGQCSGGFLLSGDQTSCTQCNSGANQCDSCDGTKTCQHCNDGYYGNTCSSNCTAVASCAQTVTCSSNANSRCSVCLSTHLLVKANDDTHADSCVLCGSGGAANCATCGGTDACTQCKNGYRNSTCTEACTAASGAHCADDVSGNHQYKCNQNNTGYECISCATGYWDGNGGGKICGVACTNQSSTHCNNLNLATCDKTSGEIGSCGANNCQAGWTGTKCDACNTAGGYYQRPLDGGGFECVLSCGNDFYVSDTTHKICSRCSDAITNCSQCSSGSVCTSCSGGKQPVNSGSMCCSAISSCSTYNTSCKCQSCSDGKSAVNSGELCCSAITSCSTYNSSCKCQSCSDGKSAVNSGELCCSAITSCSTYNSSCKCTSCSGGKIAVNNGSKCCAEISHCSSYDSNCKCNGCEGGYTANSNKNACCLSAESCSTYYDDSCVCQD